MSSIIFSIIILLVVGLCLYGVYFLVNSRYPNSVISMIAGIILILIFILVALWRFGFWGGANQHVIRDGRSAWTQRV